MNFTRIFGVGLGVVALVVVLGAVFSSKPEAPPPTLPRAGNETFGAITGAQFDELLTELRGKVVVLNFWAPWCGPCRMEMPSLIKLHNERKAEGLEVIGIAQDLESEAQLRDFEQKLGADISYRIVGDQTYELSRRYRANSLPKTVVLDRRGNMRHQYEGFGYELVLDMEQLIDKLVKEK